MSDKVIILMIGLPRSGKSTWAKKQGLPIVEMDSIRLALHGERYLELAEPMVWAIAPIMVRALLLAGNNKIIIDGTHVTEKRRQFWAKKFPDVRMEYSYIATPESECLKRAEGMNDDVIIPVIKRMAAQMEIPDD